MFNPVFIVRSVIDEQKLRESYPALPFEELLQAIEGAVSRIKSESKSVQDSWTTVEIAGTRILVIFKEEE